METWLITLICAIISAVISLTLSYFTNRYNYRHLFAETVSQSRNKWLNEMRDFISTMLAEAQFPNPKPRTFTKKYWKARNEIMLRLNLNEPLHLMLKNEILTLDNNNNKKTIENIISISQLLLKEEWEKVKKEAKGE